MSLQTHAQNAHTKTPTRVERDRGGLDNTPASASDRDLLRDHLGRDVLHGSVTRDFKKAYRRNACLLYTSPSPRDRQKSRMPSSA